MDSEAISKMCDPMDCVWSKATDAGGAAKPWAPVKLSLVCVGLLGLS